MEEPILHLHKLDDWVAEQDEEHIEARKEELIQGVGYVCAMVYQEAVLPFGIGWLFCEEPEYLEGRIVLGPSIQQTATGFAVTYEDPFRIARQNWDEIKGGSIGLFFGHQYQEVWRT